MKTQSANLAYEYPAVLGEGALWDDALQCLWWVDITAGHLHQYSPKTHSDHQYDIGISVGAVVPDGRGSVVLAVRNGFAHFDITNKKLDMLAYVKHEHSNVRFNDGKCDAKGRFWAGTLSEGGTENLGKLFCLENDISVSEKLTDIGISNGIGWSPAGDKMYYIDSRSQKITEFAFDLPSGSITSPRTVLMIEESEGVPDGMCVDAEGMLWVALWEGGKVIRINPQTRERLMEVLVPGVRKVTSCALGGENLSTLFITTARQGFTQNDEIEQPNAGSLFTAEVGIRGLPANVFKNKKSRLID